MSGGFDIRRWAVRATGFARVQVLGARALAIVAAHLPGARQ